MPFVDVNDLRLHYVEHGSGDTVVLFIHGNLACADWFELAWAGLPAGVRTVAVDWRGCGLSDKPPPASDYGNYSIPTHAQDMLAVLRALGIARCHLATHSTGGLIGAYMLLAEPERFGKVLALDPVPPKGLRFEPDGLALFEIMKASRRNTRKALALVAPTLFRADGLESGREPEFAEGTTGEQRALFERLVDRTFGVSDGIWFGTPHHLNREWQSGGLHARIRDLRHEHLVLWGDLDPFIPRADLEEMARLMPSCRFAAVAGVGHSMNIERPDLYARFLVDVLAH